MDTNTFTLIFVTVEWILRIVMLPTLILRKRKPSVCLAWMAIVFFEPIVGCFFYLLIGETWLSDRRKRKRSKRDKQRQVEYTDPCRQFEVDTTGISPEDRGLLELAQSLGNFRLVSGNNLEYYTDTYEVLELFIEEIDRATDHVHIIFYIYGDDSFGQRVGEALARAVKRGVECRLMIDSVGSKIALKRLAPKLREQGIEVIGMLPASLFSRQLVRYDLRNHRKLMVCDGRVAVTGSLNMIEPNYGHARSSGLCWHDIMARVTGPAVAEIQAVFTEDWYGETGEELALQRYFPASEHAGDSIVQVIATGANRSPQAFQDMLSAAILTAEERVILTSPYFIPDETLMMALRLAVRRGAKVDLIVPEKCDQRIPGLASRFYYEQVMEAGGNVFFFPELLHTKTLTVDNELGIFGSANYDLRSFQINFEMNLLVHPESEVTKIRNIQLDYLARSRKAGPEDIPTKLFERLLVDSAKLFSPLL